MLPSCGPNADEVAQQLMDEKVEKLISERLMLGWNLYNDASHCVSCPKCNVPLMVNYSVSEGAPEGAVVAQPTEYSARAIGYDLKIAEKMYERDVALSGRSGLLEVGQTPDSINNTTVAGVPFCVFCQCHVVTEVKHLPLVEAFDRLADREIKGNMIFNLPQDTEIPDKIDSCKPLEVNSVLASGPGRNGNMNGVAGGSPTKVRGGQMSENLKFLTGGSHADVNCSVDVDLVTSIPTVPSEMPSEMGIEAAPTATTQMSEVWANNANVQENPSMSESVVDEYNERRDIATKVLGAKMLQGYTLKESQCSKCGMPEMGYHGNIECVVCPVLIKRAAQKKNAEETSRLSKLREEAEAAERVLNNELKVLENTHIYSKDADESGIKARQDATNAARELLILAELRAVAAARREQDERHVYAQDAANAFKQTAPQSMSYWQILRDDASAQLKRRLMQGWMMTSNRCLGMQCQQSSLLSSAGGQFFCVVCGGSGDGADGAYKSIEVNHSFGPDDGTVYTMDTIAVKRQEATALIGQKLMLGTYTIANQKCDACDIPLMTNAIDGLLECVICGPYREDPTKKLGTLVLQGWEAVGNTQCMACNLPLLKNPSTKAAECITCGPVARELTRAQRDTATAEIGKRILSGWSILPEDRKCVFCNFSLIGGYQNNSHVVECVACHRKYDEYCDFDMYQAPNTPRAPYTPLGSYQQPSPQPGFNYAPDQGWSPQQQPMNGRSHRTGMVGRPPRVTNRSMFPQPRGTPLSYIAHQSDEVSLLQDDVSVAKTVASDALGAILSRIDQAKADLVQSTSESDQTRIVELIEKLASAAMAVKKLEDNLE